jgi:hypothetical protein
MEDAMICGMLTRAIWFFASIAATAGTTVSGRLIDGMTGSPVGGENAFVVAYIELPNDTKDVVILGYSHPDDQGKWAVPNLPPVGKIFICGFHRSYPSSLLHADLTLTGSSTMDIGTQAIRSAAVGMGIESLSKPLDLPHLLMNRQNEDVAKEILRLIAVKEKSGQTAPAGVAGESKNIDGLWTRGGRIYRIEGDQATIVDAGTALKTAVAVGDVVMRKITKTGASTWDAEVLWQLESEKKWSMGTLTLSADGNTLSRISTSPWNDIPETVAFSRK